MGEILMGNSHKRIAVEGARLVEDAVLVGLQLEKLFLRRNIKVLPTGLSHLLKEEKKQLESGIITSPEIHRISETQIKTWSDLITPPGVFGNNCFLKNMKRNWIKWKIYLGIFKKPHALDTKLNIKRDSLVPITLICDNIREPGNLGSIIRTATGVGCDEIYLTKGL
jgi:tRNA G18 (ribose-2'-O)-methylase SpoU